MASKLECKPHPSSQVTYGDSALATPIKLRDDLKATLDHIRSVFSKLTPITNPRGALKPPDLHKLSEGLFLSAWSHWEEFCRDLMIEDLATKSDGALCSEIKKFRTKKAAFRLAERIANHPDHPTRFVEWNKYDDLRKRADSLLGANHRFVALGNPLAADLKKIYVLRNAIAHKSDKAWEDFIQMTAKAPFNVARASRRGITPGRFISAHKWGGTTVLQHTVDALEGASNVLVP